MTRLYTNHRMRVPRRRAQQARPLRKSFLTFGKPVIGRAAAREMQEVLDSGWLGTGPRVARFEEDFARYKQAPHAIAVNSCTAALHLALIGCGVGQNTDAQPGRRDEVITTPLTFCASVNAVLHAGGTPVLADVDPVTGNLDPDAVEAAITPNTRAVLVVHYAGRCCDMGRMVELCERHGITLIEDCAHAVESTWQGQPAGTFGRFGCFSFYATKNITTGEGGMVLTADDDDAKRLRTLSLHGLSRDAWNRFGNNGYRHYRAVEVGFKYNMMDIQAALGIHQLAQIERHHQRRHAIWNRYQTALAGLPVNRPAPPELHARHACHLYTLGIDAAQCGIERDAFLTAMTERRIGVGVHYEALTELPVYQQRLGWDPAQTPVATALGRATASLPLTPYLTDDDVAQVIDAVHAILS